MDVKAVEYFLKKEKILFLVKSYTKYRFYSYCTDL